MFIEIIGTDLFIGELAISFAQIGVFAACSCVVAAYFTIVHFATK